MRKTILKILKVFVFACIAVISGYLTYNLVTAIMYGNGLKGIRLVPILLGLAGVLVLIIIILLIMSIKRR